MAEGEEGLQPPWSSSESSYSSPHPHYIHSRPTQHSVLTLQVAVSNTVWVREAVSSVSTGPFPGSFVGEAVRQEK